MKRKASNDLKPEDKPEKSSKRAKAAAPAKAASEVVDACVAEVCASPGFAAGAAFTDKVPGLSVVCAERVCLQGLVCNLAIQTKRFGLSAEQAAAWCVSITRGQTFLCYLNRQMSPNTALVLSATFPLDFVQSSRLPTQLRILQTSDSDLSRAELKSTQAFGYAWLVENRVMSCLKGAPKHAADAEKVLEISAQHRKSAQQVAEALQIKNVEVAFEATLLLRRRASVRSPAR